MNGVDLKHTGTHEAPRPASIYPNTLRARFAYLGLALELLLLSSAALPQPRFEYRTRMVGLQQQFSHISWQLEYPDHIENVTQAYAPAVFDFALSRNSHLMILTAGAWSEAALAATYAMNGVTDTQVRFSQRFADRWMIGAGVNLPTGNSTLEVDENLVANRLTESILGFPLQRMGVGTDVEFSLAHALNLSETLGLGFGGTCILPGEFEFREQQADTYKPGARYVFTTTLNHLGATVPWRLNVLAQFYGQDELNRQKVFKQGWQLEPSLGLEWRFARAWELGFNLRHVWKDDNEVFGAPGNVKPPENFYIDNSTLALLVLNRNWSRRVQAGIQLGWNYFGASNQQLSRAEIWRSGLNTAVKISEHFILNLGGDYAVGNAENGAIDLRGYGVALAMMARF